MRKKVSSISIPKIITIPKRKEDGKMDENPNGRSIIVRSIAIDGDCLRISIKKSSSINENIRYMTGKDIDSLYSAYDVSIQSSGLER